MFQMLQGEMQHNTFPAEKIHIIACLLLSTIGIQLSAISFLTDMVRQTPDFNLQMAFFNGQTVKGTSPENHFLIFLSFEDLYTITTCTHSHIFVSCADEEQPEGGDVDLRTYATSRIPTT